MGEVFLARDPGLDRLVAVKTIRLGNAFGAEAKARFEREARAAGALNHPNVVTLFEFGEDQGLHYMAMEWVEGEDLDQLIRSGARPPSELLELLAQACGGLAYAHERGIVHRDIKPANILVSRAGGRAVAKLMDFGVALVEGSDLTQQGSWMGTVNYMAPEYLDTGKAGPGSDLFAMGVVLYEILTGGRRPFAGETATSVLTAILNQPPAPFRPEELEVLPPAILEVVDRSLAKRPEDRYPGADALAAAIRRCLQEPAAGAAGPDPAGDAPDLVVGRNGRGQCMSLRVALRQAGPGARIRVLPGVYRESLVLDRPVAILGQGAPGEVVIESSRGPCLSLRAPGIELGDLLLLAGSDGAPALAVQAGPARVARCELRAPSGFAAEVAGPGPGLVLVDSTLQGGEGGLRVQAQGEVRLEGCRIEGTRRAGACLGEDARGAFQRCRWEPGAGLGLVLAPGARATLADCQVCGQDAGGLEVEADARAELSCCQVTGSGSVGVLVLERGQAALDHCDLGGHALAAVHGAAEANVQLRGCRLHDNPGLGAAVLGTGLLTLDGCELRGNGEPAALARDGATLQMTGCQICDGRAFGVVCGPGGRGVLESCEIFGNAGTGAKVESGGSLLLVRCDLHDGRDTGILLFQDAQVTLEECVVHRNARGGILLAKDAADPVLRGAGNRIQDALLRSRGDGEVVKVVPVR
jgi:hypothetical protein